MRLFISIPVPDKLKEAVREVQTALAGESGIKLVEAGNLHFTIKFLGETGRLKEIRAAMEKALENFSQFDADIAGINAFPDKSRARAVWLSVGTGFEELKALMEIIDEELSGIGFEREKGHIPHLTLARVRSLSNKAEFIRLLESLGKTHIGTMHVKEVKLMKSTLSRTGPVYEEVYSVKLK